MGFNRTYQALQEIFPEIDSRVLRAVALENRMDADAAVEVVLTKVMPCIKARSRSSSSSPSPSRTSVQSPKGSEKDASGTCSHQNAVLEKPTCSNEEQPGQFFDAKCDHDPLLDDANGAIQQLCGDSEVGTLIITKYDQTGVPVSADLLAAHSSPILESEAHLDNEKLQGPEFDDKLISVDSHEKNFELGIAESHEVMLWPLQLGNSDSVHSHHEEDNQPFICSDGNKSEVENCEGHIGSSSCDFLTLSSPEANSVHFVAGTEVPNSDLVKEPCSPKSASGEIDSTSTLLDVDNRSMVNVVLSRPAQICSTEVLEDDIALERNNKKTLFTALQSVINLMREVELEESVTEQANKEAAKGGLDILQRVEDLKEMLQHAKEANEMHAGEVNGEKAILATEVKELQTRLVTLSDETNRSLGILNEMHQSLKARLVAANKGREAAEKEKLEKEASAQKTLAAQELIMESVVQEANILKIQADENAKLREFLVERGHVVDMLQGEISVVCQDVILLKKQFDEHLPLSKSLTSSQTSCILASSSSTMKSVAATDLVDPAGSFEEVRETDFVSYFVDRASSEREAAASSSSTMKSVAATDLVDPAGSFEEVRETDFVFYFVDRASSEREAEAAAAAVDNRKAATDEGWEFFDMM